LSVFSTSRRRRILLVRVLPALAIALVGTCVAPRIQALDGERAMSQYLRDQWGSDKGFPGGPVSSIAQSADGYLWIGADKGLVRFDGLTFRLFDPSGPSVRAAPAVLGVAAAPDGSIWARLRGAALVRYQHGTFQNMLPAIGLPDSVVTALVRTDDDTILLATLGQGAIAYRGGRSTPIAAPIAMPSSSFVISIAVTRDGDTWLGTRDAGLVRVHGDRVTRLTEGLPDLKINALLAAENGDLWIGTDKGIARWSGRDVTRSGIPDALHDLPTLAMIRDRQSNVWIAAGPRGLVRASRTGVSIAGRQHPGAHVASVFEDRDGSLWVGTDRGIERWRDPVFTTFSVREGLPSDAVGPVYVDPLQRTWFAPTTGGLYWIHDGAVRRISEGGLDKDVIYSIHGGSDGDVWVGRQRGGLTRLRGKALAVDHFTHADGLAQDSVYAVHRARDGAIWAGTLSGGASRFKDGQFTTYDTSSGLAANTVPAIADTRDGTMWFATPNGLSARSRGGWRRYSVDDGLPSNDVNTLFEDRDGILWVGTAAGLAFLQAGTLRQPRDAPARLRSSVLGLAEDRAGGLWVATVDRVLRVTREALLQGAVGDGDLREYGVTDGLIALEGVKRHRTVVADSRGRIWFALNRGLSMADAMRVNAPALPALTHVEDVSADGTPYDVRKPIAIPSSRRRIAFGYAGLSLSVPERVRFRYRLDGFDRDWSNPVTERQAVYTNLGPGEYRFRVMASNSDGLWNGGEAILPFVIQPMFWQTASFRFGAVLLCGVAGWGLYRLRVRQVARQLSGRFEERLAERTRIAQELHDTLLQGFVSASMQLHVAVDKLPDESPAKASLSGVTDLMRRVIDEGRNAVRGLRSSTGAPHDLEQAFSGIQHEIVVEAPPAYRVIVEGRRRPLKPIIRDEVYRIGREGLVNAFRHSGATSIELEIEYGPRELRLFVRDDGRGMDAGVLRSGADGHWGITGMQERAERIGGSLKMRSRAGAGTEIDLRVPGHIAFQPDAPTGARSLVAKLFGRTSVIRHEDPTEKQS
jgi:ligand-binding sensor domain-containing protein/signal transduction histidine kinase